MFVETSLVGCRDFFIFVCFTQNLKVRSYGESDRNSFGKACERVDRPVVPA